MPRTWTESRVSQDGELVASIKWRVRTSSIALAMALMMPSAAYAAAKTAAADAPEAVQAPADDGSQIQDIIVTARRVQERSQGIPASVSAVTGDQVSRMTSLSDIQSLVSGVTFKTFGPIPTVGIRGYGNRTVAGNTTNSTVGIFQDGVFISPPLVVLSSRIDTERVEVAKGPQSTLYGRSSFTGAINIVSSDPAKEFSGYVDAGYGTSSVHSENIWSIKGALSIPLGDTLSVRFFGLREKRDGYTYDSFNGNRGAGYDRKIGRVRFLWEPSDVVTARLTGTIVRDNLPLGLVHTGLNPAPLGQRVIFGNLFNPAVQAAQTFGSNVWDAQYAFPQSSETRGEQITLDLRFNTPIGELASLTDYQHSFQKITTGLDLTRLGLARGNGAFDEKRHSQELRLSNTTGRFSYLLGLYYLRADSQAGDKSINLGDLGTIFGPGSAFFDLLKFKGIYSPASLKTEAYAAFGQLGYDITDKLKLTVGVRQGHDEISGTTATFLVTTTDVVIPSVQPTYRKAGFNATTGSANLSYKIAPDVIVYASYARGNSPGGLNSGGAALVNFGPQKVDAYEVGLKSKLFDRHLQLNAALFDNRYSDIQLTQNTFINGVLTPLITNAAKARGRGFDLDAIAVLSSHLRFGLQYTYADSKITSYKTPPLPAPQVDFTGVPLVRSPKHSLNGSATFTSDIGPGKFLFTAEESYTSSYTNDYQGVPAGFAYPGIPGKLAPGVTTSQVLALYRTPGYAVTNLNASYTWNKWQLSGYMRNVFNHQYIAAVLAFDTVSYPQELPGEPRTFGASLKYSF
jgi:iron complex outermembrane receptor protein